MSEPGQNDIPDPVIGAVAEEAARYPEPPRTDPVVRVMAAVRKEPEAPTRGTDEASGGYPSRILRLLGWLLTPRPVRIRPALVMTLLLVAGVLVGRERFDGPSSFTSSTPAASSVPLEGATDRVAAPHPSVQFVLVAPEASRVALVGDFNGWDPTAHPLSRTGEDGVWTVELPVEPGRHTYAFLVDGREWRLDRGAPLTPPSEFGRRMSVLLVDVEART